MFTAVWIRGWVVTWKHNALAKDLADHLLGNPRRLAWLDIQLGPVHSPRPDVYTLDKSYVQPCPTAYEVKVSVQDFRSDVTSGKWQTYLNYAEAVYFCVE